MDSFAVVDTDNDGSISRSELKEFFLLTKRKNGSVFHKFFSLMKPTSSTKCSVCGRSAWGSFSNFIRCISCGTVCHAKCRLDVLSKCPGKRNLSVSQSMPLDQEKNLSSKIKSAFTDLGKSMSTLHFYSGEHLYKDDGLETLTTEAKLFDKRLEREKKILDQLSSLTKKIPQAEKDSILQEIQELLTGNQNASKKISSIIEN